MLVFDSFEASAVEVAACERERGPVSRRAAAVQDFTRASQGPSYVAAAARIDSSPCPEGPFSRTRNAAANRNPNRASSMNIHSIGR